jgi:dTDP-glucose 4,6-dehydratase
MKNILITGGAGFIGSNFLYEIVKNQKLNIFVVDKLGYASNYNNISSLVKKNIIIFFKGDILNTNLIKQILVKNEIDTIINFAAESHVDRSIHNPKLFIKNNIIGTNSLLVAAYKVWKNDYSNKRFHQISTDEVYGDLGKKDASFTEKTPYSPNSPYAASKASSDFFVKASARTYGIPITISNCSNNFGPFQYPEKLIPLVITNVLKGKKIPIYGKGSNIRDWIYVSDHCNAILKILEKGKEGETYNIGGNYEISNLQLVKKICRHIDFKFKIDPELKKIFPKSAPSKKIKSADLINFVKDRPGHDRRYSLSSKKIQNKLGFHNKIGFDQGIEMTINWYLLNKKW